MAVHPMGKPAVTHYRIMEHFRAHTSLRLRLGNRPYLTRSAYTWLTSAIRWWAIRCTVAVHVRRKALRKPSSTALRGFDRRALHATMLRLYHPISGIHIGGAAPLPQDMVDLINALKATPKNSKIRWTGNELAHSARLVVASRVKALQHHAAAAASACRLMTR